MQHLGPTLGIALLVGFMIYRRTKRTIGLQKIVRSRLIFRIIVFGLLGCMFLYLGVLHPINLLADGVGLICGLVLGHYAIKHTQFERQSDGIYYRTHLWVNIAVLALLVGRIAYRLLVMSSQGAVDYNPSANPMEMYGKDPWTIGIFFVLVSYYIRFFTFLLSKGK
ncbi:CcdC protein domain-containing protein [Paenibacillus sp. UNC451MF]|uniref:CcdC protein domain-containing protein n=1 Tax=Paenibacillus sp. UNC451MF TaxID=1449063 RepID=UPI0004908E96|nr:CcdC protein domain-containing protein [Paenibacillus sp. UNC451MF]